eukprot:551499_1
MSVDRACILLLSTKTWDLSGGRKGGFQSYREPLSIFELITAVFLLIIMFIFFYIHKRIDLNSLKWSNIGRLIKLNSKQSEMIELYSIPSLLQFEFNIILGQYEMVCLNGIRSSSQQIELLKSINGRIIFVFALNGSGIYLTASFGIAHDDLDPAFTRLNKRFYSFENRIKLLITFTGDPLLDGLISRKKFESFDGPIMLLSTSNGSNKALGRGIIIFINIFIKNYENTIHKNYNNITGPTNAALTVVTSNIITNNCIIQRNGLIIYVDMFLISYVRNIIYIIVISTMKNRLRCEKSTFLISGVRNITNVTILYIYSLIKWVIMLFRIQKSLKQITETIQFS